MRRAAALLLILSLVVTLAAPALASTGSKGEAPAQVEAAIDLDFFTSRPEEYVCRYFPEGGCTLIWPNQEAADCAFTHAHESEWLYSYAQFQLAVYEGGEVPVVIPRLEITYSADQPIGLHSVSIDVDGLRYTFDIADADYHPVDTGGNGWQEHTLILFSDANWAFVEALTSAAELGMLTGRGLRDTSAYHAVLHGEDEDLDVTFHPDFLYDFWQIVGRGMDRLGGTAFLHRETPKVATPMCVTAIPDWPAEEED